MKFSCETKVLLKGIQSVEKAISVRSSLPVLENVYLEAVEGLLLLRGYDMELGIENRVELKSMEKSGSVLLQSKTILGILSKISDPVISFEVDDSFKVVIRSEKLDFDILGLPGGEYPAFPSLESGVSFSIKVEQLMGLLKYSLVSVSTDESKPFLNGVFTTCKEGVLSFVSTDGFRLSLRKLGVSQVSEFAVIVPSKAYSELLKLMSSFSLDQDILVSVSSQQIVFSAAPLVLISRLVQGKFPDYRQVIPESTQFRYRTSASLFLSALDRASIIASNSNNLVKLTFSGSELKVYAQAPGVGEFHEVLELDSLSEFPDKVIAFNVKLLLDLLKTVDIESVSIAFNSEIGACRFESGMDQSFLFIVMPIRTSDFHAQPVSSDAQAVPA